MVLPVILFSHLEVLELNNGHQTCCWFCFEGLPLNCLQSNRWWWFPWTLVSWMIYLHHIYSSDSEHWREKCQTYEALSFYTYVLSSSGSRNKIPSHQPGQYLHAFIIITDDIWLHFLITSSIQYLHHSECVHVANHQGISLVFPFGNNDTISASAYNVSFFELCIHNSFWVGFTITS